MRSIAFSLIFHKSMALVLTPIFVNLLKFLCHVSIISYLCCVVWLQPCGRLICGMWSVVLRSCSWNLRNFNAIQDEDDNGSRCMAWTDCICIFIAGFSQGTLLSPHDTVDKVWRHLNFFEHPCYLHARVPRLRTDAGSIEMVEVPWARFNSGFTMLFEAFSMALIEEETPVNSVAW